MVAELRHLHPLSVPVVGTPEQAREFLPLPLVRVRGKARIWGQLLRDEKKGEPEWMGQRHRRRLKTCHPRIREAVLNTVALDN